MQINLGDRVKDRLTGFSGIAVAETQWLYGCRRITIQPEKITGGKVGEALTFDEPQIELVKAGVLVGSQDTGGPRPEPVVKISPR